MDAFVTCIYNGLANTSYGGRNMRDARYRESLMNIASTGAKIFCFTSSSNYASLVSHFAKMDNIQLIIKDLDTLPMHVRIQEIKQSNAEKFSDLFWSQRCVEIMWGKFFMIDDILQQHPEVTRTFWIDAGLFHNDVISPKYFLSNKFELTSAGLPLFSPVLMQKINEFIGDKLLLIQHVAPHNRPIDSKYNDRPYENMFGGVGGLFGGDSEKMKVVCKSFFDKMYKLLADSELCSEEGILSAVHCDHSELFKTYQFQSWYHEGWADRYNPNLITFSNFFDDVLDNEVLEDNIIFCALATGERFRNLAQDYLIKTFLTKTEESIKLIIFTDLVSAFPDYGERVIIKQFDVPCTECAFHYGLKYKVVQETHELFDSYDKIFYLDADCYFRDFISKDDFKDAVPGLNTPLGNLSSAVINPAIVIKYNAIVQNVSHTLPMSLDVSNVRQFRECAMLFKIDNKYTFHKFLAEWRLLYEFTRDNKMAYSGEYVEISFAALSSEYPLVDVKGQTLINLRRNLMTLVLNNPIQAIF
jgi:hypothetical protein